MGNHNLRCVADRRKRALGTFPVRHARYMAFPDDFQLWCLREFVSGYHRHLRDGLAELRRRARG